MRTRTSRTMLGGVAALGLAALALVSLLPAATAAPGYLGPGFPGHGPFGPRPLGGLGPWVWVAGGLVFLFRILLLIGLAVLVWRVLAARRLWQRPDQATQILRERYARGEISEDEYRKRLATLG